MLDETPVIWGGEFGRPPVIQGGGDQPGTVHGETDEFGFHATRNRVDVHDLHATILHTPGIDHRRLTFRHQRRDFRLTDVSGEVIRDIL